LPSESNFSRWQTTVADTGNRFFAAATSGVTTCNYGDMGGNSSPETARGLVSKGQSAE